MGKRDFVIRSLKEKKNLTTHSCPLKEYLNRNHNAIEYTPPTSMVNEWSLGHEQAIVLKPHCIDCQKRAESNSPCTYISLYLGGGDKLSPSWRAQVGNPSAGSPPLSESPSASTLRRVSAGFEKFVSSSSTISMGSKKCP